MLSRARYRESPEPEPTGDTKKSTAVNNQLPVGRLVWYRPPSCARPFGLFVVRYGEGCYCYSSVGNCVSGWFLLLLLLICWKLCFWMVLAAAAVAALGRRIIRRLTHLLLLQLLLLKIGCVNRFLRCYEAFEQSLFGFQKFHRRRWRCFPFPGLLCCRHITLVTTVCA